MTQRIRNTEATRRRAKNIRRLVAELAKRDMNFDEFCDLLDYSPSGVRKYVRDLREDGLIEIARFTDHCPRMPEGRPEYRLAMYGETLAAYMATLIVEPSLKVFPRNKRPAADDGCHFHTCGNDNQGPARARATTAKATHLDVHEAFFGRAAP